MIRTVSVVMISVLMALVLLFQILGGSCETAPPVTRTFQNLIANKTQYAKERGSAIYTDGLVIYLSNVENEEFFVATYPGVSKETIDRDFIVVRARTTSLSVGDIISIKGTVESATGKLKSGEEVTVYYLDGRTPKKTGQINIEDPNFEELIEVVRQEIQREDSNMFFIIMIMYYFIILNPALNPAWNPALYP